jgi:hypothetical protein
MRRVFNNESADEVEELAEGMDPYLCPECLAEGDSCGFHAGFAAGWDACVSVVASAVDEAA